MLAERLLAKPDFDTDTEVRTLEHLKKRFGENNLHSCEVSDVPHVSWQSNSLIPSDSGVRRLTHAQGIV